MRITELLDRPMSSLSDVAAAITGDPALALKTLRLVNSAFHGVRENVTSVEHAVVMLGAKVIRNLVLTASIVDTFENDAGDLLRHSICCGVAMRSFVNTGYIHVRVKQRPRPQDIAGVGDHSPGIGVVLPTCVAVPQGGINLPDAVTGDELRVHDFHLPGAHWTRRADEA
jgi:hypothetical protein